MKSTIHCRTAITQRDLDAAVRIRWEVFGQEKGYIEEEAPRVSRELDRMDTLDTTLHIVAYAGGEPAGAARLLLGSPEVARNNGLRFGLHLEMAYDLNVFHQPGVVVAETTRVCVLQRFRGAGVFDAVYAALLRESLSRGVTHWVASANIETDDPADALIAYRVAESRGLVDRRWAVAARGPSPEISAPRHPIYTAAERARARSGELRGLRLPLTLLLYARKGARFIGPPAYDRRFHMCSMPLVVEIAPVREAPSHWALAA